MARIRTLKPELLEDEKTASLSDGASRLFTALILLADDHGNVRADGRWLKGQIWWARDDVKSKDAVGYLLELGKVGLVQTYNVNAQVYCHITNWSKHQRIDNAGKPRVPAPSVPLPNLAETLGEIPQDAAIPPTSDLGSNPDPDHYSAPSEPEGRKHKLPADWVPDRSELNLEAEATAKARGVDLREQLKNLRDWAKSNNAKKVDWDATWRNWTRNAKPSGPQRPISAFDAVDRAAAKVAAGDFSLFLPAGAKP